MEKLRRHFLHLAAGAAALPVVSRMAKAQAYPSRPITMIVPYAAGGPVHVIARVLVQRMRGRLGQPVLIENVAGAGGSIGLGRVAHASPDGHTVVIGLGHACRVGRGLPAGLRPLGRLRASGAAPQHSLIDCHQEGSAGEQSQGADESKEVDAAAHILGLRLVTLNISGMSEVEAGLAWPREHCSGRYQRNFDYQ
jgi:hypothetical protein